MTAGQFALGSDFGLAHCMKAAGFNRATTYSRTLSSNIEAARWVCRADVATLSIEFEKRTARLDAKHLPAHLQQFRVLRSQQVEDRRPNFG